MTLKRILILIVFIIKIHFFTNAQSFFIGSQNEQLLRPISLVDTTLAKYSLFIRPVQLDSTHLAGSVLASWFQPNTRLLKGKKFNLSILPSDWISQLNTHHPYGWNDGPIMGAKGYQTLMRLGMKFQSKYLDIQLMPEMLYLSNDNYPTTGNFGASSFLPVKRIYPGQSYLKVKLNNLGFSIASENLWWGSGIDNSLMITNNAPGFKHFSANTERPISTFLGDIEFKVIGGILSTIPNFPIESYHYKDIYPTQERYLSAFITSVRPKFLKNLYVGFGRALQHNSQRVLNKSFSSNFLQRFFPVLSNPIQRKNISGDDTLFRDQIASLFFRLVFPRNKIELYGEFGYNDYKLNFRDFALNIPHSSAYLIGIKKVIEKRDKFFYDINFEMIQLSQSPDQMVRWAGSWYRHFQLLEGLSNQNQIIGAGVGYGTNMLSLKINKFLKTSSWTFLFNHVNRDPDGDPVFNPGGRTTLWNDWVIGIQHKRRYEKLFVDTQLQFVNSNNYAWEKGKNTLNIFARLGLTYTW